MKMRKQLHNKHYDFIRKWKILYPNCRKVNCRGSMGDTNDSQQKPVLVPKGEYQKRGAMRFLC